MKVMPGSEGLWLVHSGAKVGIRPRASSTRSAYRRSSRFGSCKGIMSVLSTLFKKQADRVGAGEDQESPGRLNAGLILDLRSRERADVIDAGHGLDQRVEVRLVRL